MAIANPELAYKAIMQIIGAELEEADKQHQQFSSTHEGMGVLQEEMYELWDAVRSNDNEQIRKEATQVGAMAIKLLAYIYRHHYYIGMDMGFDQDATVVTITRKNPDGNSEVIEQFERK